jgi:hypothetical protein
MKKFGVAEWLVMAGVCVAILLGGMARPEMCPAPLGAMGAQLAAEKQTPAPAQLKNVQGEKTVSYQAKGTFEPTVTPEGPEDKVEWSTLGRWSLTKKYHGDLEGTSEGQMLAAGTNVKGSAGYVAMERVTGALNGRQGSFVLQHSGTMAHGALQLSVIVVPDSGTGELAGIAGTMTIKIEAGGKHFYEFAYSLPKK